MTRLAAPIALAAMVPTALVAADTWTGPSVGINLGLGTYTSSWTDVDYDWHGGTLDFQNRGLVAGATVGYDHQIGSLVIGAAFDWDRSAVKSDMRYSDDVNISNELESFRTLRVRVGVTTGASLLYLTAGVAKANIVHTWNEDNDPDDSWASFANDGNGRVLGIGLEHLVSSAWSVRIELLKYDFGETSSTNQDGYTMSVKDELLNVRAGVSYRF